MAVGLRRQNIIVGKVWHIRIAHLMQRKKEQRTEDKILPSRSSFHYLPVVL
jgi:hypothetical protein